VVTVIVTMMAMAMEDMVIAMMVAMVIAMMMAMVTVMQANTGDMDVSHRQMFALSFWITLIVLKILASQHFQVKE